MTKRKQYILSPKKPKRKMPSQQTQRARDIQECARGQNTETRKSCFRDPYATISREWYEKIPMTKSKKKSKK